MKKDWTVFQEIKKGKHTARNAFNELCNELLNKHYPTKKLIQTPDFTGKEDVDKQIILYQAKFFIDNLTNSRKGQIRQSFKETIELLNSKKQTIFAWIVCLPMDLTEEDLVWWHNWKSKMTVDNNISIKIFEGKELLKILQKYKLYNKWFEIEENIEEKKIDTEEDIFEFALDSNLVSEPPKKEDEKPEIKEETKKEDEKPEIKEETKKEEKPEIKEETKKEEEKPEIKPEIKKEDEKQEEKTEIKEKKTEKKEEIDDRVPEEITEKKKIKAEKKHVKIKYTYDELYTDYNKTKSKIARLSKDDKAFFDEIYNNNDMPKNRFAYKLTEVDKKQLTTDLYYVAKLNKINEKYEKALLLYEELLKREDLGEAIPIDEEDIRDTCNFCGTKIYARNKVYEGDYYYTKDELITSLNCYEKSHKLYPDDKITYIKYNETFGDSLLSENLFLEARQKYKKARKLEQNTELIDEKSKFALYMIRGNKLFSKAPASLLNPLFSPRYYSKASKIDNENKYLQKRKKEANKKRRNIIFVFLAIILIFFAIKIIPPVSSVSVKTTKATKVVTMYDVSMKKANFYYDNFSNHNAHYLDSAMAHYRKAIYYKPNDSLAPIRYEESVKRHQSFINDIQTKIKLDTTAYFVGVRKESEGLRLFKYMFEPYDTKNVKYGYVDGNYNVVIPPIYDFAPEKMKDVGENFKNGKALVCLKMNQNNTYYFLIDKRGTRVSKKFRGIKN